MKMTCLAQWIAFLLMGFSLGCGGSKSDVEVATVTGEVTLDQQPLADALVMFQPESGRPAIATTDSSGRYVLQYTEGVQGAVVGKNKVVIRTEKPGEDGQPPVAKEKLPKKYHDETTLSVEVKPGPNTHDFPLTSN